MYISTSSVTHGKIYRAASGTQSACRNDAKEIGVFHHLEGKTTGREKPSDPGVRQAIRPLLRVFGAAAGKAHDRRASIGGILPPDRQAIPHRPRTISGLERCPMGSLRTRAVGQGLAIFR